MTLRPGPAGIPLTVDGRCQPPLQAVPDTVALVGCRHPDGSPGAPLPPGTYAVVPVLAYGQDPLQNAADGSAQPFTLVGPPSLPHRQLTSPSATSVPVTPAATSCSRASLALSAQEQS